MRFKYMIIILNIFLILLVFNCKKSKDKIDENMDSVFAVNTTKTVKGEINNFIEVNGDVKAKNEVSIYPDVAGKLVILNVKLGDPIYKNQIIGYIDPSKPGMNYLASPVRSTINGAITSLPLKIGSTVNQNIAIAKVGDLNQLEIITSVSEKFISKMKSGLNAIIKTQAYPDKSFKAKIYEVSPVVDPQSRMLEIKLMPDDSSKLLMPGMFVELKIITEKKDDIVKIPTECIIKRYGEHFVFVIKNKQNNTGIVEKRKIIPGIQIENKTEIITGLKPDEEIVFRGQTLLEDQSKVRIIETIQPLSENDVIE